MNYMYKVYLIAFLLTIILFIYDNKEHFDDDFVLPGKFDINIVYFYSNKSNESMKLKEQMLNLKETMNNNMINCFKIKFYLVNLDQKPLVQKKYNINQLPTIFIMYNLKNKIYYENYKKTPSYILLTDAINNIYSKRINNANLEILKQREKNKNNINS